MYIYTYIKTTENSSVEQSESKYCAIKFLYCKRKQSQNKSCFSLPTKLLFAFKILEQQNVCIF